MENTNKTVVLVGRPNVGKSTLFNRLIGRRRAIETDVPGTTRDRLFGQVIWCNQTFDLVDLAGVEFGSKKEIDQNIQSGVELAIESADLILFMVDWNDPENEHDRRIARNLRKYYKKVILVINKADNISRINKSTVFNRLGQFDNISISAISGKNTGDLLDLISKKLGSISKPKLIKKNESIKLTIIGRPNTGKSTLINTIVGEKRVVVSAEAGTTRDVVEVNFFHKGKQITLLDTAGIRRRGKIKKDTIESFSLLRTQNAIKESEITVLLIDAEEGLVASDAHILGMAIELGKGVVLAINKIDLWDVDLEREKMGETLGILQQKLNFAPYLPVVFISAQDNKNIKPLLNQVVEAQKNRATIIEQPLLNRIFAEAKEKNEQIINLVSISQKKANPPIFEVIFKGSKPPHQSQIRYLENKIRDSIPLTGTPIFIDLKSRKNRIK